MPYTSSLSRYLGDFVGFHKGLGFKGKRAHVVTEYILPNPPRPKHIL